MTTKETLVRRLERLELRRQRQPGSLPTLVPDDTTDAEIARLRAETGGDVQRYSEFAVDCV